MLIEKKIIIVNTGGTPRPSIVGLCEWDIMCLGNLWAVWSDEWNIWALYAHFASKIMTNKPVINKPTDTHMIQSVRNYTNMITLMIQCPQLHKSDSQWTQLRVSVGRSYFCSYIYQNHTLIKLARFATSGSRMLNTKKWPKNNKTSNGPMQVKEAGGPGLGPPAAFSWHFAFASFSLLVTFCLSTIWPLLVLVSICSLLNWWSTGTKHYCFFFFLVQYFSNMGQLSKLIFCHGSGSKGKRWNATFDQTGHDLGPESRTHTILESI